jgi:hypothetical protein
MELGLGASTTLPLRKGLFGKRPVKVEQLIETAHHLLSLSPLASISDLADEPTDDGFGLIVHPAAEPVTFRLAGQDLRVAATTSTAGPGYHAYLVDLLDRLVAVHGAKWRWRGPTTDDADGGDDRDHTGYAVSRDFGALQRQMAQLHRAACRAIADSWSGGQPRGVGMPRGFEPHYPDGTYAALTPTGPLTIDEVRARAAAETDEALVVAGAEHFPWWDEGFGSGFHAGVVRHAAWMAVPWTSANREDVGQIYDIVLDEVRKAAALGAEPLSADLVTELESLGRSRRLPVLPAMEGVGYLRRLNWREAGNGWRVLAPGSAITRVIDGQTRILFALDDFEVVQSCRTAPSDQADEPWGEPGLFDDARLVGKVVETEGQDGFQFDAFALRSEGGLVQFGDLIVWYRDPANRSLAEQVVRSMHWRAEAPG